MKQITQITQANTKEAVTQNKPEFIRLPKGGLCPYTNLSRSKLNQLILPCEQNDWKPKVKSICLRQPGAVKGTRLIVLDSLLEYLYSQLEVTE